MDSSVTSIDLTILIIKSMVISRSLIKHIRRAFTNRNTTEQQFPGIAQVQDLNKIAGLGMPGVACPI